MASELDDILESALDEFEAQEREESSQDASSAAAMSAAAAASQAAESNHAEQEALETMRKLLDDMSSDETGDVLHKALQELAGHAGGRETLESAMKHAAEEAGAAPASRLDGPAVDAGDVDRTIAATLQMLDSAGKEMQGGSAGRVEETAEQMMNDMMNSFGHLREKEDYDDVVDGIMKQLLSKQLMYEPMVQVCDRFPQWLAEQKEGLSEEEYNRYGRQYQCFQRIVAVYETEPDNYARLMELMFDVQQYGSPPADIIRQLAPGLHFDEQGMPVMPNMGLGAAPDGGLPNLGELAAAMGGGEGGEAGCCVS